MLNVSSPSNMIKYFSNLLKQEFEMHEVLFFRLDSENKKLQLNDHPPYMDGQDISLSVNDRENPVSYSLLFSGGYRVQPVRNFPSTNSYYRLFYEMAADFPALCVPINISSKPYGVFLLFAGAPILNSLKDKGFNFLLSLFSKKQEHLMDKEYFQQEIYSLRQDVSLLSASNYETYADSYIQKYWVDATKNASRFKSNLIKASKSCLNVLIVGESGSGKKHLASVLHHITPGALGEFVVVNCLEFDTPLELDFEIFGVREKQSSKCVRKNYIGAIEQAVNGTLLLENIECMSANTKKKIYKAISDRQFFAIGGDVSLPVKCRVIFSQHKKLMYKGLSKNSLKFQQFVGQIVINTPLLNEEKSNVVPLAKKFLKEYAVSTKKDIGKISESAKNLLKNTQYQGGSEELKQVVFYSADKADFGGVIKYSFLVDAFSEYRSMKKGVVLNVGIGKSWNEKLDVCSKKIIEEALVDSKGNVSLAAKKLGLSRRTLTYKCMKLDIKRA